LYDSVKHTSRLLEKNEIECLKSLLPVLLNDPEKMLVAVQITDINPAKLMKLPQAVKGNSTKKEPLKGDAKAANVHS
jgi:hypothetical protein